MFDFICKRCYNHKSISNQHSKCRLSDSQRDNNKDCKCPPCFECVYFLDVNEQSNAI